MTTEFKIPLGNYKIDDHKFTYVSEQDYENANKHKWSVVVKKENKSFAISKIDGKQIRLHHFILGKPTNPQEIIFHKDGNHLNNTRENIEITSSKLHYQTKTINRKNKTSSQYIGLSKKNEKWCARYGSKKLKMCDKEEEAAAIYDTYVLLKFGKLAKTNGLVKYEDICDKTLEEVFPSKNRELPKNIVHDGKNYYGVIMYEYKHYYSERCEKLEDAVIELEILKNTLSDMKKEKIKEKEILKDSDGNAIIPYYNKKSEFVLNILVDEEKWYDLMNSSWIKLDNGNIVRRINGKLEYMHSYLLNKENSSIYHINNIKHDNRLSNLKILNNNEDYYCLKKHDNSSSSYYGVFHLKAKNKWIAYMKINEMRINRHFTSEIEAAIGYNVMLKHYNLNYIKCNDISAEDLEKYEEKITERLTKSLL